MLRLGAAGGEIMRPLLVLLVCCVSAACNLETRAQTEPQNGVCLRTLQFENMSAREVFLATNAATIADRFNPPGTLYLQTDSPQMMRVVIAAPNCADPTDLSPLTRTDGISSVRAEFTRTFNVEEDFAGPVQINSDADESACIVIAHSPSTTSRFGQTLSELTYGGVRFRQVLSVGDRTFIASDEECDLTLRFVEAVADELALASANPQACRFHTLRECVGL